MAKQISLNMLTTTMLVRIEGKALKGCLNSLQNVSKYYFPYFSGGTRGQDRILKWSYWVLLDQQEQTKEHWCIWKDTGCTAFQIFTYKNDFHLGETALLCILLQKNLNNKPVFLLYFTSNLPNSSFSTKKHQWKLLPSLSSAKKKITEFFKVTFLNSETHSYPTNRAGTSHVFIKIWKFSTKVERFHQYFKCKVK